MIVFWKVSYHNKGLSPKFHLEELWQDAKLGLHQQDSFWVVIRDSVTARKEENVVGQALYSDG